MAGTIRSGAVLLKLKPFPPVECMSLMHESLLLPMTTQPPSLVVATFVLSLYFLRSLPAPSIEMPSTFDVPPMFFSAPFRALASATSVRVCVCQHSAALVVVV